MKALIRMNSIIILSVVFFMFGCGGSGDEKSTSFESKPVTSEATQSDDPMKNKGIGPIQSITLGPIDQAMVDEGQKIYQEKCSACHKPEEKFIGPAPKGIMDKRSPEWIMNMILSPEKMVKDDPIAKQLLMDYNLAPMANQNLTEDQARKILEYFRTLK
jgi:mono/diheme cytochrome c family protein